MNERPPIKHTLKTWPKFFSCVMDGSKTFEARRDDRDFMVGDTLELVEFDPETETLTGRSITKTVTYIMRGGPFCKDGFCVMSIAEVSGG